MSNALEAIAPKILARGMKHFCHQAIMPRLVRADFSAEAAQKGDTIDIPIAQEITVEDVAPSHTPPQVADSNAKTVSIQLDNWKRAAFYLTDKELTQIDADNDFVPLHMREAVSALASAVNQSLLNLYTDTAQVIGSPNGNLFTQDESHKTNSYSTVNSIIGARTILNSQAAPKEGRSGILSFENEADMLALPNFSEAHRAGDSNVTIRGEVGQKYGINWFSSDDVVYKKRTKDVVTIDTVATAGNTDMTLKTLREAIKPGDVLIVKEEVVGLIKSVGTFNNSAKTQTIKLHEPLVKGIATDASIHILGNAYNNLVFHADAFALAMRPLTSSAAYNGLGNRIMSVVDPETGLSMRLEISRQYKQTVWEFDILWGVKMVRPEWAVRVLG